jgi:hypothetical protein
VKTAPPSDARRPRESRGGRASQGSRPRPAWKRSAPASRWWPPPTRAVAGRRRCGGVDRGSTAVVTAVMVTAVTVRCTCRR